MDFNTTISSLSAFVSRDDSTSDDGSHNGYTPTLAICILFVVLFSLSTIAHLAQAVAYRTWFMCLTVVLAGLIEILGWTSRFLMAKATDSSLPFTIQITAIIIGPTPLLAANFVIMGRLIRRLGTNYSRLRPRLYTVIFLTCDIVSLALQGLGGGMASTANDPQALQTGTNVMLGGIVFQLVVIIVFVIFSVEFVVRYRRNKPARFTIDSTSTGRGALDPSLKMMLYVVAFNTTVLFIRGIYRTIELADGWDGKVMATQWLFNVFDGAMVTFAFYALNIGHPGMLLRVRDESKVESTF